MKEIIQINFAKGAVLEQMVDIFNVPEAQHTSINIIPVATSKMVNSQDLI